MSGVLLRFAERVDALSIRVGTAAAWIYPVLTAVLIVNVVARYGFGVGSIELEEIQWHLFAAAFLLGFAYTQAVDEHVRVDIVHERLGPRARAWVELLGSLVLLLPFAAITSYHAFEFTLQSWQLGERSPMPSGLPARYLVKAVLFVAMALLSLQACAVAARSAAALARPPDP